MSTHASNGTVPAPCTIDNCNSPSYLRGWCCAHYQRWRIYGDPLGGGPLHRPRGLSFSEAIAWELRNTVRDGECMLSRHAPGDRGYVGTRIGGRYWRLHRAVLQHTIGRPLGRREEACHTCHRPLCINPDHLYVGSHQDNMTDMKRAGRGRSGQRPGENNSNAKLTNKQAQEVRQRYARGDISQENLAAEYGVTGIVVFNIVHGRSYR